MKIHSPDPGLCLLWAESQTVELKNGAFSLELGHTVHRISGASGGVAADFRNVFVNNTGLTHSGADCASGNSYTPTLTDDRLLTASFNDSGNIVQIAGLPIKSVPFAMQAQEVGGYGISNLMKISGAGSAVVFSEGETQSLKDLLGGDLQWNFKSRRLEQIAAPLASTDAATKGYVDTKDATTRNWVTGQISSAGGGTVLSVSGASPISVANGTSSPVVSIQQASGSQPGYLSSSDWVAFNNKQPGGSYLTSISGAQVSAALGFTPLSGVSASNVNSALGYTPVNRAGDSMTGALTLPSNGLAVGSNQLVVSGGNVGIGTTSPSAKLHIVESIAHIPMLLDDGAYTYGFGYGTGAATSGRIFNFGGQSGSSWISYPSSLQLREGSTARIMILPGGNVGIGTTSPGSKLEVSGNIALSTGANRSIGQNSGMVQFIDRVPGIKSGSILIQNDSQGIDVSGGDITIQNQGGGRLGSIGGIYINGTSSAGGYQGGSISLNAGSSGSGYGGDISLTGGSMTGTVNTGVFSRGGNLIFTGGNIGDIATANRIGGGLMLRPGLNTLSNSFNGNVSLQFHDGTSYQNALTVRGSTGYVGIGTTSPGDKLHVEGKIRAQEICDITGGNCKDLSQSWAGGSVASVGVGGLPLSVSNGSTTPQISIAQANAGAAGYLSAADWNAFNNKQPAGAYLTSVSSANVTSALGFTPLSSSLASNQVLVGNGSSIAASTFFGIGQMRNSLGTLQFPTSCTASQTLTWSAVTDVLACSNIGSLPASSISSGTIDSARLPFGASLWADGNDGKIYYNSGNVGVGTTSPGYKLDVAGGIANFQSGIQVTANTGIRLDSGNGVDLYGQGNSIRFRTNSYTERMRIDSAGNIGIGTASPASKLEVAGMIHSTTGGIKFPDGTTQTTASTGGGSAFACPAGFTKVTAASQVLGCMQNDENNSSAVASWYVANNTCFTSYGGRLPSVAEWYITMNNYALSNETDNFEWAADKDGDWSHTNAYSTVGYSSITTGSMDETAYTHSYRCWISASGGVGESLWSANGANIGYLSGNVGIGTTTPQSELHIRSAGSNYTGLEIENTAAGGRSWQLLASSSAGQSGNFSLYDDTAGSHRIVVESSGNVGIGTTDPTAKLEVNGALTASGLITGTTLNISAEDIDPAGNNTIGTHINTNWMSIGSDGVGLRVGRTGSDGALVQFSQGGNAEGSISVTGTTVSYNAFTGSHFVTTEDYIARGELVESTGSLIYKNGTSNSEPTYKVQRSATSNSPRIIGSMLGLLEPQQSHDKFQNPFQVMAVGNGDMWVADNGQNVEFGDYLISSSIQGHAEKDIGRYPIAHVVARAVERIDWQNETRYFQGVKHKKISVFFEQFERRHSPSVELMKGEISALTQKTQQLESENKDLKKRLEQIERRLGISK